MKRLILFQIVLVSTVFATLIFSQWSTDPQINFSICTAGQTQRETEICRDSEGNFYIFWRDYRNEPTVFAGDIYAQKLNINGEAQWSADGIPIVSKPAAQFDVKALFDGKDGIYLVWREAANLFSDYKIYVQRINLDGTKLWGNFGILLQNISGKAVSHSISLSEDGDLLVSWHLNDPSISSVDIYAQKISNAGIIQWVSNGLKICNATGRHVYGSSIISDKKGGAYITWSDNRTDFSNLDIYAQQISANGNILWAENGIPVCEKTGNQGTKHLIANKDGGTIIFWEDIQETYYSLCAQSLDSSGNKLWESNGKVLINNATPFAQYEIILDKNDEIFSLWQTAAGNINIQKINYDGTLVWSNSISVCSTQSSLSYLAVYPSDVNGIIVAWLDGRKGNNDIYSQWISTDGETKWDNNGVAVCSENHEQADYAITSDKFGGAVIAWADMRNGNFDVYTQNIDVKGDLGTKRYLFQKNGLNKIISSQEPALDSLSLSLPLLKNKSGYYSISVTIDSIIHPAVNELTIKLSHLTVTDTIVYNLSGGENLFGTVLDDYALNNINSASSPFAGMFKPYKELSQFIVGDLNGEWILSVDDNNSANDGRLKSWGLVVNKAELTDINTDFNTASPEDFILYQNYPNPFNPSTIIKYTIPGVTLGLSSRAESRDEGSRVQLKVFDVLGRVVTTLVDEYKPAGNYEVEFQSAVGNRQLPSGVYFYQLKAGDFLEAKKMILLK